MLLLKLKRIHGKAERHTFVWLFQKVFTGKGIQYAMAKDLVDIASDKHLDKIVTKFMRPQEDLMGIYKNLGFSIEGVLPDYVKDLKGEEQDMVIMVTSLKNLRKAQRFVGNWLDDEHSTIGAGEM